MIKQPIKKQKLKGLKVDLTIKKKPITAFRPMVRSRHKTHNPLREKLPLMGFRSVVRLGSTWAGDEKKRVECNTVAAVKNSASKLRMKECFQTAGVTTADWGKLPNPEWWNGGGWVVAKAHKGSRGKGNYLLKSGIEYEEWKQGKDIALYIFEKFYDYSREYRLHVTEAGCFYTCRKMLKENTPGDKRWFRNDSNSSWMIETNPLFDKPVNWNTIIAEAVKALKAVGLDVGGIDVKVQSRVDKKTGQARPAPRFIILETNSAPSFGEITLKKYLEEIPKILKAKKNA